ncbi:MAG: glutamate formimidoyltransferase [Chloroflexi bacterium]|nr:glutamate formimidoyltransferase [Chloroflexota bacterium]
MPAPLVECIPNFSEARRPEVVESIQKAIASVPGVLVLDRHSDLDHNRSVITFIGSPQAVEEAAFQAIATASRLIDLNQHIGEHPRIGAADVVPFVPISDVTMLECVEMARRLGSRVGEELVIPVYLYEEAATRPDRQNLENIRHGQYERLKEQIATDPNRQPDFGPAKLGPAGAVVIGARQPLIAYNIYLNTDDVSVAQRIAHTVRNSSGGLRYVKGLGMLVGGRAQVSMNLTNYHLTPLAQVVEMVRREAMRYGTTIHHGELVGLIPQQALFDAAQWYMQLDGFTGEQVLEQRVYQALSASANQPGPAPEASFLENLAAGTPTPGGGSAAAHTGAEAAALVAMVARLTIGKKKYAAVENRMWEILEQAEMLRKQLSQAVVEDSAAFDVLLSAVRLPKETPREQQIRQQTLEEATLNAAQIPLQVAGKAVQVMDLAVEVAATGNQNAISDAASAAALAGATLTSAGLNVQINSLNLQDQDTAHRMLDEIAEMQNQADALQGQLRKVLADRGGLAP